VPRPRLEIADIFRAHGPAWRQANAGHVSLTQLKVMSAIEACRTAALGGHVAGCAKCGHRHIAYNSCKNRHDLPSRSATTVAGATTGAGSMTLPRRPGQSASGPPSGTGRSAVRRATAFLLIAVRTGPTAPRKSLTSGEYGSLRVRHHEPCARLRP
jgi:hypothetical protein